MTSKDRALCFVYVTLALAALVGTWRENLLFARDAGGFSIAEFVRASGANHAAASLGVDLGFFCAAAFVFMVVEARRVGVRFVWVYVALSLCVAVSVMFPLFLVARQRRLAALRA